jgi:hypothetical protein
MKGAVFEGTSASWHASGNPKLNFVQKQQMNCTTEFLGRLGMACSVEVCYTRSVCRNRGGYVHTPIRLRSWTAPACSTAVILCVLHGGCVALVQAGLQILNTGITFCYIQRLCTVRLCIGSDKNCF